MLYGSNNEHCHNDLTGMGTLLDRSITEKTSLAVAAVVYWKNPIMSKAKTHECNTNEERLVFYWIKKFTLESH